MKPAYLFAFAFVEAVAFWQGALEAAFTLRWATMAIGAPLFFIVFGSESDRWTKSDAVVLGALLILAVFGIATQWSTDRLTGYEELFHLSVAAGVFCVGLATADLRYAWRGLAAGVGVSAIIAVAQVVGWQGITQTASPGGLFVNKNVLAEAGMVALVAVLANRDWRWSIGPLLAIVLGHSAAVYGALGASLGVWFLLRGRLFTGGALLYLLGIGLIGCFILGAPSAVVRTGFWKEAIAGMSWMGNGLGSFPTAFRFAEFAHNESIHYIYELGVLAIVPAAVLFYLWLERNYETERLVLTSVIAISILSFPFHMPVTLFAASLAASALARGRLGYRPWDGRSGVSADRSHPSGDGSTDFLPVFRFGSSILSRESASAAAARRARESARNEELATFRSLED